MLVRLLASAALAAVLAQGTAIAQGTSANSSNSMSQSAQQLPQELEQKLQSQGFTDVQVVPGSYIVTAKDKDGDPITAIIGPHSMSVFTVSSAGSGETTGSSSNDGMSKASGGSDRK